MKCWCTAERIDSAYPQNLSEWDRGTLRKTLSTKTNPQSRKHALKLVWECGLVFELTCYFYYVLVTSTYLGDNCIQNFHLGRYIVGYTVGNLVLRRRASGAVKRDFRTYIRRYTSPNEKFEYGYPNSNALLQFRLK